MGGGAYGCRSHSSHGRYSERVKSLPLQICFRDFSAAEKYASNNERDVSAIQKFVRN